MRKLKTIEQIKEEFAQGKVHVEVVKPHHDFRYYIVFNDGPSARLYGHNVHENRIEIESTWVVDKAFELLTTELYEITSIVREAKDE